MVDRVCRRVRPALRHRSLRPADRAVADGEVGPGRGRALGGGALLSSARSEYIGFGGTGKQVRDFLHIDDFCDLVLTRSNVRCVCGRAVQRRRRIGAQRVTFGVDRGVREATGNRIPIGSEPENRPADIRIYVTDHRRVTQATGWAPRRDVATVVSDICSWIQREEAVIRPLLGR